MLRDFVKSALSRRGYALVRVPKNYSPATNYVLYDYKDADGKFDYEGYKRAQTEGNKRKINKVFVDKRNIEFLANYLRRRLGNIRHGICHGTRRGLEQSWFREFLGADVIGTEISDTATQFPHTIEWDFHNTKPEWIDHFDFVYSNSFDHSYDPSKCLSAWVSCLRPGGLCILEHSRFQGIWATNSLDPFGADLQVMPYLICRWGAGQFSVREIMDVPAPIAEGQHAFIVVQRFADVWAPEQPLQST